MKIGAINNSENTSFKALKFSQKARTQLLNNWERTFAKQYIDDGIKDISKNEYIQRMIKENGDILRANAEKLCDIGGNKNLDIIIEEAEYPVKARIPEMLGDNIAVLSGRTMLNFIYGKFFGNKRMFSNLHGILTRAVSGNGYAYKPKEQISDIEMRYIDKGIDVFKGLR